jgi:crotonobetaine/carnitine-CoA ligase
LFLEYLDNDKANSDAFTEGGWFRTGDIMRLGEDGSIIFMDRDSDRIKVGGENVSAGEVEAVIAQIPGVIETAVVARKDHMLDAVPVAFVKRAPDHGSEAELRTEILQRCESLLSKFKRPQEVRFIDDFPRAALQKISKADLRNLLDSETSRSDT